MTRLRIEPWGIGICFLSMLMICSCNFSRPPAPVASNSPPVMVLKFVSYSRQNQLMGYFSLGDAQTNQVAWEGVLRLQLQSTTVLSLSTERSSAPVNPLHVQKVIYDQTFAVEKAHFHWEKYGSFLKVEDLVFRFSIPYDHFGGSVPRGKVVRLRMEFNPRGASQILLASRDFVLY